MGSRHPLLPSSIAVVPELAITLMSSIMKDALFLPWLEHIDCSQPDPEHLLPHLLHILEDCSHCIY